MCAFTCVCGELARAWPWPHDRCVFKPSCKSIQLHSSSVLRVIFLYYLKDSEENDGCQWGQKKGRKNPPCFFREYNVENDSVCDRNNHHLYIYHTRRMHGQRCCTTKRCIMFYTIDRLKLNSIGNVRTLTQTWLYFWSRYLILFYAFYICRFTKYTEPVQFYF